MNPSPFLRKAKGELTMETALKAEGRPSGKEGPNLENNNRTK